MSNNNMLIGLVAVVIVVVIGAFMLMQNQGATQQAVDTTPETALDEGMDTSEAMVDDTSMTVTLAAVAGSDPTQTGTATLTEKNGQVEVVVNVVPSQTVAQPAHVHMGACPGVGEVAYPLTSLQNGTSTTMLDVTMADLLAQKPLAINIHKSEAEVKVYTACGSL